MNDTNNASPQNEINATDTAASTPLDTANNAANATSAPQPAQKPKKKKFPVFLIILLAIGAFIVSAIVTLLLFVILLFGNFETSISINGSHFGSSDKYIAVMYIDSEIAGDYTTTAMYGQSTNYDQVYLVDTLTGLIDDNSNAGLLLYINSPGGEVIATDEFCRYLSYYKQETGRPIYAYFADYATSGAYWIGSYADVIIANPYCVTGSIGVTYGSHIDISGMLEKLGIDATSLTAGDNKAMGSMYEPLTEEQKALYQEQLDEIYERFVDVVATNRNLPRSNVYRFADGRTFLASKALEYGLIDGIGYFDEVQQLMIEAEGLDSDIEFYDFYDVYESNFITFFIDAVKNIATVKGESDEQLEAQIVGKLIENRRFMVKFEG